MAVPLHREPSGAEATAFWNIRDIQIQCRVSRSTAWRVVREDGFPAPVVLGRAVLWPSAEVLEFLELRRRPEHYRRHTGAPNTEPVPILPVGKRARTRPARGRQAAS